MWGFPHRGLSTVGRRHGDAMHFLHRHVEQAVERYGPGLVMSLIWRINGNQEETADLYQEVFVKFHETTSERGPLQQPKAWLCRTAINAALDFNRSATARFVSWRLQPSARDLSLGASGETSQLGGKRCGRKWFDGRKDSPVSLWICPSAAEKSSSSATSRAVPLSRSPGC